MFNESVNFMINNKIVIWGKERMSDMDKFKGG